MKQALHIFRKDARQMRYEIVLTVVAMSVYAVAAMGPAPGAVSSPTPAMVLVPLAAWVLIARVIHAETLPGDSQFWLTRPYRRGSLLLAKALFIVAFVMLPFLAADVAIALRAGFRLGAVAPALLWRHAAFAAGFVIPVAALASVTSGLAQMLLGFLVAWVVAVAPAYLPNPKIDLQWEPLLWIGLTGGILVVAIAAAGCVGMQYARRSTWVNRGLISAAWIVAEFGFALVPWKLAYQVQTVVAGGVPGAAACKVEADVRRPWLGAVNVEADRAEVELPVVLSGLPAGAAPVIDALTVEVRSPDGEVWSSGKSPTTRLTTFGTVMSLETVLPRPFYERVKDKPVRVNGAVFLTFKGAPEMVRLTVGGAPVEMPDGGLCVAAPPYERTPVTVQCRYAFRQPAGWLEADIGRWSGMYQTPPSYAPVAAGLDAWPMGSAFIAMPEARTAVSVVRVAYTRPAGHLRRDFVLDGVVFSRLSTAAPAAAVRIE